MAKILPFARDERTPSDSDTDSSRVRQSSRRLTRSMRRPAQSSLLQDSILGIHMDNLSAIKSASHDLDVAMALSEYVNNTILSDTGTESPANPHQVRHLALKLLSET